VARSDRAKVHFTTVLIITKNNKKVKEEKMAQKLVFLIKKRGF